MKKIILSVLLLFLAFTTFFVKTEATMPTKIMWDNMELKTGQIGRVTMLKSGFTLSKYENGEFRPARVVKKGEVFRVYGIKVATYATHLDLGNNLWAYHSSLRSDGSNVYLQKTVNYETPSKSKLALLKEYNK